MGFYRWTRLDEKTSIMCVGCAKGSICFTNDKINDGNCAGYIIIDDMEDRLDLIDDNVGENVIEQPL